VLTAETLTCAHCGSASLYPYPGLLGELGAVLHRVRYACRDCHRNSWLRPDAEVPGPPPDEAEPEALAPPCVPAVLDDLDLDVAPLPPAPADLTALDEHLAQGWHNRKRR
jgi:hypothetical protein